MWEEWFKWLLGGSLGILGWWIDTVRREFKKEIVMLWQKMDDKEKELKELSILIAKEYPTKRDLYEIKKEIKDDMEKGFQNIINQIKLMMGDRK